MNGRQWDQFQVKSHCTGGFFKTLFNIERFISHLIALCIFTQSTKLKFIQTFPGITGFCLVTTLDANRLNCEGDNNVWFMRLKWHNRSQSTVQRLTGTMRHLQSCWNWVLWWNLALERSDPSRLPGSFTISFSMSGLAMWQLQSISCRNDASTTLWFWVRVLLWVNQSTSNWESFHTIMSTI